MSTKIYDGLMFNSSNLIDVYHQLDQYRDQVFKLVAQETLKLLAWDVTKVIDLDVLGLLVNTSHNDNDWWSNIDWTANSFWGAVIANYWNQYRAEVKEPSGYKHYVFDLDVTIHPVSKRKILAIPFGHQTLITDLKAQSFVKNYGYWNNTDHDEDVTPRQWNTRKRDWDIALPDSRHCIPAYSGLTVQLVRQGCLYSLNKSDVLQYIPSVEQRASRLAEQIIWGNQSNLLELTTQKPSDFMAMTRSPETKQLVIDKQNELISVLPHEITLTMLKSHPKSVVVTSIFEENI